MNLKTSRIERVEQKNKIDFLIVYETRRKNIKKSRGNIIAAFQRLFWYNISEFFHLRQSRKSVPLFLSFSAQPDMTFVNSDSSRRSSFNKLYYYIGTVDFCSIFLLFSRFSDRVCCSPFPPVNLADIRPIFDLRFVADTWDRSFSFWLFAGRFLHFLHYFLIYYKLTQPRVIVAKFTHGSPFFSYQIYNTIETKKTFLFII